MQQFIIKDKFDAQRIFIVLDRKDDEFLLAQKLPMNEKGPIFTVSLQELKQKFSFVSSAMDN